MRYLTSGCAFSAIDRNLCGDATNSVKLLSIANGPFGPSADGVGKWTHALPVIRKRLRVNNARCHEDVVVESAKFREV
jgi:hypothetical protein